MSRLIQITSHFTGGEVAADVFGRVDLRLWNNGAARLRNVFVRPTGGVTRRPGLRWIDTVPDAGRLVAFTPRAHVDCVLVFVPCAVWVGRLSSVSDVGGASGVAPVLEWVTILSSPWDAEHLPLISWCQQDAALLVVHPDVAPYCVRWAEEGTWTLSPWVFAHAPSGAPHMPFERFGDPTVTLTVTPQGVAEKPPGLATITASAPVFTPDHVGVWLRIGDVMARVTSWTSAQRVDADVIGSGVTESGVTESGVTESGGASSSSGSGQKPAPLAWPAQATTTWTEQAFSAVRGWPGTVTFHQNRLVIGGSRSLPHYLWMSKIGAPFHFGYGQGHDDAAIQFPLLSDQVETIRHVCSGRHLQVFTTHGEWMVTGEPLTPVSVVVRQQTRVGSPAERTIPLCHVEGATVFIGATGAGVREYVFTDTEQAYQARDLSLVAAHLVNDPRDMAYDARQRLIHIVMGDGTLATVTNFRREHIAAWSAQHTTGAFLAVAVIGGQTFVLVRRAGKVSLECFDPTVATDAARVAAVAPGTASQASWGGFDAFNDCPVQVRGDDRPWRSVQVKDGWVHGRALVRRLEVGLPFAHTIEPLPPAIGEAHPSPGRTMRLVRVWCRTQGTETLMIDTGRGPQRAPRSARRMVRASPTQRNPPQRNPTQGDPTQGDVEAPDAVQDWTVQALGWSVGALKPLWRIVQDDPSPCTLLSVTMDITVTGDVTAIGS